jgi:hypothetical protein
MASHLARRKDSSPAPLQLETLEDRTVPSVTLGQFEVSTEDMKAIADRLDVPYSRVVSFFQRREKALDRAEKYADRDDDKDDKK